MGGTANPAFLVCDADVVFQFFIAGFPAPLKCLRDRYGVQPIVVPEVDVELRRRPQSTEAKRYASALGHGHIAILDVAKIRANLARFPTEVADLGAEGIWSEIQTAAESYSLRVDTGEAYTYAAAVTLRVPMASNDARAIRTLRDQNLAVPSHVLRAFDLVALAVQSGAMTSKDADLMRGRLREKNQHLPKALEHASFEDALAELAPRLVDASAAPAAAAPDALRFDPLPR